MRTARRCCGLLIGPLSFFSLETHAAVQDVLPSDFAPSATLITFDETGTTELPSIPGVSFPYDIGVVVPLPNTTWPARRTAPTSSGPMTRNMASRRTRTS